MFAAFFDIVGFELGTKGPRFGYSRLKTTESVRSKALMSDGQTSRTHCAASPRYIAACRLG